jgi:hypothetical protein
MSKSVDCWKREEIGVFDEYRKEKVLRGKAIFFLIPVSATSRFLL